MASNYLSKDEILSQLNLSDYLVSQGYEMDKKKSSSRYLKFKNPSTGDRVLIDTKKDISKQLYYNLDYNNDRGDLISFVQNRISGVLNVDKSKEAFYKAFTFLNEYIGGNYISQYSEEIKKTQKRIKDKKDIKEVALTDHNHKAIDDYSYLTKSRKISLNTLKDDMFKDRLFNTYFKLKNEHVFTNWGYGKYENNKLVGMEVRNNNFQSILGKHEAVFSSNPKFKDKEIDCVFISESAHDVLAHYEILKSNPKFDDNRNIIYFSLGGNLYKEKLESLLNEYDHYKISSRTNFVSITDNDKAGNEYDLTLAFAHLSKFNRKIEVEKQSLETTMNPHFYVLKFESNKDDKLYSELQKTIEKENERINSNAYGENHIIKKKDDKIELFLTKQTKANGIFFKELLTNFNADNLLITHKVPGKNNDWNDYLKSIKEKKTQDNNISINQNNHKKVKL